MLQDHLDNTIFASRDKASISGSGSSQSRREFAVEVVVVQSSDRNIAEYPNPAQYDIDLSQSFRNVSKIELIQAFINDSQYNIDSHNNLLPIANKIIPIVPGVYSPTDLASTITHTLGLVNLVTISCAYHSQTQKYIFTVPQFLYLNGFRLDFRGDTQKQYVMYGNTGMYVEYNPLVYTMLKKSLGPVLGFSPKLYIPPTFHISTSTYDTVTQRSTITLTTAEEFNLLYTFSCMNQASMKLFLQDTNSSLVPVSLTALSFDFAHNTVTVSGYNLTTMTSFSSNCIVSDFAAKLNYDDVMLLQLENLERFVSISKHMRNSFALIPSGYNQKYFDLEYNYGTYKQIEPLFPHLSKLQIRLCRTNGELYNFNNSDHTLIFAVHYKTSLHES